MRPRLAPSLEEGVLRVGLGQRDEAAMWQVEIVEREHHDGEVVWRGLQGVSEDGGQESLSAPLWSLDANDEGWYRGDRYALFLVV